MTTGKSRALGNNVAMRSADLRWRTRPHGNLAKNVLIVLTIALGLASVEIARAEEKTQAQMNADFEVLMKAAEAGNTVAQDNLGHMYYEGEEVERNEDEAIRWFKKAAAKGYAPSQHNLGFVYFHKRELSQKISDANREDAYFWANLAVALGSEEAVPLRRSAALRLSPSALGKVQKRCDKWMADFHRKQLAAAEHERLRSAKLEMKFEMIEAMLNKQLAEAKSDAEKTAILKQLDDVLNKQLAEAKSDAEKTAILKRLDDATRAASRIEDEREAKQVVKKSSEASKDPFVK